MHGAERKTNKQTNNFYLGKTPAVTDDTTNKGLCPRNPPTNPGGGRSPTIDSSFRLSFNEFLRKLMMFKVEPIAGEIVDSADIFDILIIINVFRTCLQF